MADESSRAPSVQRSEHERKYNLNNRINLLPKLWSYSANERSLIQKIPECTFYFPLTKADFLKTFPKLAGLSLMPAQPTKFTSPDAKNCRPHNWTAQTLTPRKWQSRNTSCGTDWKQQMYYPMFRFLCFDTMKYLVTWDGSIQITMHTQLAESSTNLVRWRHYYSVMCSAISQPYSSCASCTTSSAALPAFSSCATTDTSVRLRGLLAGTIFTKSFLLCTARNTQTHKHTRT